MPSPQPASHFKRHHQPLLLHLKDLQLDVDHVSLIANEKGLTAAPGRAVSATAPKLGGGINQWVSLIHLSKL